MSNETAVLPDCKDIGHCWHETADAYIMKCCRCGETLVIRRLS